MSVKNLYYEKYIKYKNKYLNLYNQIAGRIEKSEEEEEEEERIAEEEAKKKAEEEAKKKVEKNTILITEKNIDDVEEIVTILKNNELIKTLIIDTFSLNKHGLIKIQENLNLSKLETLTIRFNNMNYAYDITFAKGLSEALKKNKLIKTLNIVDILNVEVLAPVLIENTSITTLDLNFIYSNEGFRQLVEALKVNRSITTLSLKTDTFYEDDLNGLIEVLNGSMFGLLGSNSSITNLRIFQKNFTNYAITKLVRAMTTNKKLKTLKFYSSYDRYLIDDDGVFAIADLLKNNKTLTSLYINSKFNSKSKDNASKIISTGLKENNTMKTLSLHSSILSNNGWQFIADVLKDNTTLRHLHIIEDSIIISGEYYKLYRILSETKKISISN